MSRNVVSWDGVLMSGTASPHLPIGPDVGDASLAYQGLTEIEATERLAARGRLRQPSTSRSYASIVRANVFTIFNLMLAGFGLVTLVFGDWRDALFLGILVANSAIGITQEARAKKTLDRLALLVAPTARVVRDGRHRTTGIEEVVVGDLLLLQAGDQLVADGRLLRSEDLHLDESVLTGESRPVSRERGQEVRSGAYVTEGAGALVVTAVGEGSYAQRLLGQARSFRHPRSPLEQAINRLLVALLSVVALLGTLLGYSLWHRQAGTAEAVATATAGVISLVPEGLVLLVSLTYAVGSARMAKRGVLSQQLNAIESLASADVICLDKTGTLTESALRVIDVIPVGRHKEAALKAALARYGSASSIRNATMTAIAQAFPDAPRTAMAEVPFASRRRWSAVQFEDEVLVLGAPELFDLDDVAELAEKEKRGGRRVVVIARARALEARACDSPPPPADALGLIVLGERLRAETRATVQFFRAQGVELKVLSGDAPETVAAIAADAGIAVTTAGDGRELPTGDAELERYAEEAAVVGRITPEGKRAVVEALTRRGRHVVMVGDGVNDVPALKAARLAIAQGTGTQMAKSVADLVLVDGNFAAIPALIAEGRQALRNLQRVAKLYVTKAAFAAFLILTIGTTSTAYPLLPRHFSLVAALTIGIPTFFLALAPSAGPWRPAGFVSRVSHFAVPAGTLAGVGVVASYLFALEGLDFAVAQARTVATTVVMAVGLYLIVVIEAGGGRRTRLVSAGCALLAVAYVVILFLPFTREFFALATLTPGMTATAAVGTATSVAMLIAAGFLPGGHAAESRVNSDRLRSPPPAGGAFSG